MSFRRHIPDAITSMNLVSGLLGVIAALSGHLDQAFLLMILGGVFDFFDGMSARLLGVHTDIGGELDSLADMVTFGVLPSLMMHALMKAGGVAVPLTCIPLALAVFSALRLAKFNIDPTQSLSFIGLPTPAAAIICGSTVYFAVSEPASSIAGWCAGPVFLPLLALVLSALLVSRVPMFSLKFKKGAAPDPIGDIKKKGFLTIAAMAAIVVVSLGFNWSVLVLLIFVVYVIMNLAFHYLTKFFRGRP